MIHAILLLLMVSSLICNVESKAKSFKVQFQQSRYWSADEWLEYNGKIPQLKEFTSCHWEKLRYFARKVSQIWSYCFIPSEDKTQFNCIQLSSSGDLYSANRDAKYSLYFHGINNTNENTNLVVSSFRHRTWNHVCWAYSSISNSHQLFYNGEKVGSFHASFLPVVPGSDSVYEYAFVFGQETDKLRGSFSASQAFYGDLSEFHLWDRILKQSEIQTMSTNKKLGQGSVISWNKNNYTFHGVTPIEISDTISHFGKNKQFVIFPQRQIHTIAIEICLDYDLYKGENDLALWLGAAKIGNNWISYQENGEFNGIKYNNWTGSTWKISDPGLCAYMKIDGHWAADESETCKYLQLCTICELPKIPVFSLKGLCRKGTNFQWQYYPTINLSNQIDKYEGFKRFQNISVINEKWTSIVGRDSLALSENKNVFGRREWDWLESSCSDGKSLKRNLTFSSCEVGEQFTCSSGSCIPIYQRCDNKKDCRDGSDEEGCITIDIPKSYDMLEPPSSGCSEPLPVSLFIEIENINDIDTKHMMIDTTMKIKMFWKDKRLEFRNLPRSGHRKYVNSQTSEKLWLPTNSLVFNDEIVGGEYYDKSFKFSVKTNSSPLPFDIHLHQEELIYRGKNTQMKIDKRIRIRTTCNFQFEKFPFDNQECRYSMYIKDWAYKRVKLIGIKNPVLYKGGHVVGQFQVKGVKNITLYEEHHHTHPRFVFSFTIMLARDSGDGLKMIIFPSLVLYFLAFLTLRIDVEDLTNRNRTSVTALLVLVTLFGAISTKDDFPQTSGFKYIDIWFLWYLTNTFLIICHHVGLSKVASNMCSFGKKKENDKIRRIKPLHSMDEIDTEEEEKCRVSKMESINSIVNILFFLGMIIFNAIYFVVAT